MNKFSNFKIHRRICYRFCSHCLSYRSLGLGISIKVSILGLPNKATVELGLTLHFYKAKLHTPCALLSYL